MKFTKSYLKQVIAEELALLEAMTAQQFDQQDAVDRFKEADPKKAAGYLDRLNHYKKMKASGVSDDEIAKSMGGLTPDELAAFGRDTRQEDQSIVSLRNRSSVTRR